MRDLRVKGWIVTILEGSKFPKQNILEEMKSIPEVRDVTESELEAHLQEMLEDGIVRRIIAEEGYAIREYWELSE